MALYRKAGLLTHAGKKGRQVTAFEFNGSAAVAAHQVVAMAMAGTGIAVATVVGVDAASKAQPNEQIQSAVDGHQPHGGTVHPGPGLDLSGAGIPPVFQQCPDHGAPGLSDAVARSTQLLDDALLSQHVNN